MNYRKMQLDNLMQYSSISPALVLTSSRTRSGLVRELSRFTWENAEETRTSPEQIFDQSAMRSGAEREIVTAGKHYHNLSRFVGIIELSHYQIITLSH